MSTSLREASTVQGESLITLELDGIGKSFADTSVLRDIDLRIDGGEIHTLMGENGAGKSTLVKIISGVQSASAGEMRLDGVPVTFASPRDAETVGITIMHQELSLVPDMTVAENVMLGHEPRKHGVFIDRARLRRTAANALARFGFDIDVDTPIHRLRIGEQQLVEIVRALQMDTRLLIMDEPTSALSQTETDILMEVIRDLALRGVAIVYISHRMDEVFDISDRITVLRDGNLTGTTLAAESTERELVELMVGRPVEIIPISRSSPPSAEVVLEVRELGLRDSGRQLLDGVSLSLHRGEVLGVGGLLGAGRTELLETLFGARGGLYDGEIRLEGRAVNTRTPAQAIALGLALITEDRKAKGLILANDVQDNVVLPQLPRASRFGRFSARRRAHEALTAIEQLRIAAHGPEHIVGSLSGGNQQKVVLGKWLGTRPVILLLDEPTRGIDIGAKDEIYELVGQLADRGTSILFASSETSEFLAVCDRVVVLCEGRIAGELERREMSVDAIKSLSMQFR